jgi:sulfite reductase beta subunit-like hemoprotein
MSHIQLYEQGDMDYGVDNFRRESEAKMSKRIRPSYGRRRGKSPQSVNGIHRRRNRKINW